MVVQSNIQERLRKQVAPKHFTGNKDRIYALYVKVRRTGAESHVYNGKDYGIGQARLTWQVAVELSEHRPEKLPLSAAVFTLQTITEGRVNDYFDADESNPTRFLGVFLPQRIGLYLSELEGEEVSSQVSALEAEMARPQTKASGFDKAGLAFVDTMNAGMSAAGNAAKSLGSAIEVMGDPQVAAYLDSRVREVEARNSAIELQNARLSRNIQQIRYEARNSNMAQVRELEAQQASAGAGYSGSGQGATQSGSGVDVARERCLARGAQWDAGKRICNLQRSVPERRQACAATGGVLFEEDYICWRGMTNTQGYVSDALRVASSGSSVNAAGGSDTGAVSGSRAGTGADSSAKSASGVGGLSGSGAGPTGNAAECEPVSSEGVRIPKQRIPGKYWCYRFSYEQQVSWDSSDQSAGDFYYEASSQQAAASEVTSRLKGKAARQCAALGFGSGVSVFSAAYERGSLSKVKVSNCRSSNRMGTESWLCDAQGAFICGEPQ